jgi:hypothetical protein
MSNQRLLKKVEITSTVNSINIDDVFSEEYDKYIINMHSVTFSNGTYLHGRVIDTTGYSVNSSVYDYATGYCPSTGSVLTEERAQNVVEWESLGFGGAGSDYYMNIIMQITNPTDTTKYTFYESHCAGFRNTPAHYLWKSIGVFSQFDPIGGLELFPRTGTLTGGVFHVYGLARN